MHFYVELYYIFVHVYTTPESNFQLGGRYISNVYFSYCYTSTFFKII